MKVRLQSVGMKDAIPAVEMKTGDVRIYNFGATELVIKVIEKSEKTLTVISYNNDNGKYYIYDIRKTTPVAIIKRDQDVSMHKPQYAEKVGGRNKGIINVSEYFKDVQTQETQEKPQKIKVKSITFLWSELNIIKDNTIVLTWKEANEIIKNIALYADDEEYIKTAFLVTWENGTSYRGRIDVESKHFYKENPLSDEIYNEVLFLAGMKKPAHMTQESYNNYLDSIKSNRKSWKNFLDTYMLCDE